MTVPYAFGTATTAIPLSQLDSNFNTTITIGNTAVQLGNTITALANCTVDGTNAIGFLGIPQNAQTGNYTLVATDAGKHIYHASGSAAATYTIPANASVAYATGTAVSFVNLSANAVTIAITSDTMYLSSTGATGSRTLAQYGTATTLKTANTAWIIAGSGLT
jgi:hypothetical protein